MVRRFFRSGNGPRSSLQPAFAPTPEVEPESQASSNSLQVGGWSLVDPDGSGRFLELRSSLVPDGMFIRFTVDDVWGAIQVRGNQHQQGGTAIGNYLTYTGRHTGFVEDFDTLFSDVKVSGPSRFGQGAGIRTRLTVEPGANVNRYNHFMPFPAIVQPGGSLREQVGLSIPTFNAIGLNAGVMASSGTGWLSSRGSPLRLQTFGDPVQFNIGNAVYLLTAEGLRKIR